MRRIRLHRFLLIPLWGHTFAIHGRARLEADHIPPTSVPFANVVEIPLCAANPRSFQRTRPRRRNNSMCSKDTPLRHNRLKAVPT